MEEVWPDQDLRSKLTNFTQKLINGDFYYNLGPVQYFSYYNLGPVPYFSYYNLGTVQYFSKASTSQRILFPALSSVLQLLQKMR